MTRTVMTVVFLITVGATSWAQDTASAVRRGGRAFTPSDWYRVTKVQSPAVSPDGKLIAVTVTTVRQAENKRHSEVWVVPATGGEATRFTSPSAESNSPRFSPNGKYLIFSSTRPGVKGSIWAIRLDHPAGEAFVLDSFPPASATTPSNGQFAVWSEPVTDNIADSVAKANDPYAKMVAMARPPYGAITRPVDPLRFDGRHIVDLHYKGNGEGFIPGLRRARVWRPSQIWVQLLDERSKRKQITNTAYSHESATISPDGKWIAFVADTGLRADSIVEAEHDSLGRLPYDSVRDEGAHNDRDIFVIPASGGQPRRITRAPGSEEDLAWSSDSKSISFVARPTRIKSARLYVVSLNGGAPRNVLGNWQYEPDSYVWLSDGRISMSASVGGREALFIVSPKTGAIREVLGGRRLLNGLAYDAKRTRVAYVSTSVTRPTELYVANVDGSNERKLTGFNDKLNAEIAWSDAERFTYKSVGGLEIEGWLMKPFGYTPGQRYPLVLSIHGGPHSSYSEMWFDEFQTLAGAGMMVLYTNPRGSGGYGGDFAYVTRGHWGMDDYQDLMKAVDLAAARPDVDSTRMGVAGGSYGGFMTAWITTKTHRFKAAETDRMISNWTSWYGVSDLQWLTEFEFYGKPWENWALYDRLSPIRYAECVTTPTLIVQSEEDYRAPIEDAEQWFIALQKHGVPVEFVRYPRSTHELSRSGEPWLLVDRLGRLEQWFAYWLGDRGAAKAAVRFGVAGNGARCGNRS